MRRPGLRHGRAGASAGVSAGTLVTKTRPRDALRTMVFRPVTVSVMIVVACHLMSSSYSWVHVQPPLISNAFAPARLTVSGPVKLLLSIMSLVLVLFNVAS